jgi:S1-C subfamily serine protease
MDVADSIRTAAIRPNASGPTLMHAAAAYERVGYPDSALVFLARLLSTPAGVEALEAGTWRYSLPSPIEDRLPPSAELADRHPVDEGVATMLPQSAEAWARLAFSRGNDGDLTGAVAAIERALVLDGGAFKRSKQKAYVLRQFSSSAAQRAWLDTLLSQAPNDPDLYHELALWARRVGDRRAAASAYVRYLELLRPDPDNPFASFIFDEDTVAVLIKDRFGSERLIRTLHALVSRDTTDQSWLLFLGRELRAAGRPEEALPVIRKAVALDERSTYHTASPHFQLGTTLFVLERFEEAVRAFRRAYAINPDYPGALFNQAAAHSNLNQHAEAFRVYGQYVLQVPDDATGWVRMGYTASRLKRPREAAALLERAQVMEPGVFDTIPTARETWERAIARAGAQPPATPDQVRTWVASVDPAPSAPSGAPSVGGGGSVAGTGSGFAVSAGGYVLTNAHVVDACVSVRVRAEGREAVPAAVVRSDDANDLALLRAPRLTVAPLGLRAAPARPGESVVVTGYPLSSVMGTRTVTTTGSVSALVGLGNDARYMQISAPVQAGNSGGPVLDQTGAVVGIVASKLDAGRVYRATGDLPQNVNFAIKASVARLFLEIEGLSLTAATGSLKAAPDVAAIGRRATVLVECIR